MIADRTATTAIVQCGCCYGTVVVISEKQQSVDDKLSSIIDYSSSSPVKIIARDGKPVIVRWTSTELDSNSRTDLMQEFSSICVSLDQLFYN